MGHTAQELEQLRAEFVQFQFGFHQFSDHYSVVAQFAAEKVWEAQAPLLELISGFADILEHDCGCPPCIGSMAPAEDLLGRARALEPPCVQEDHQ